MESGIRRRRRSGIPAAWPKEEFNEESKKGRQEESAFPAFLLI
jgi:hypothetical protein